MYKIILKYLQAKSSLQEKEEVEKWKQSSPENESFINNLRAMRMSYRYHQQEDKQTYKALNQLKKKRERSLYFRVTLSVAASLTLLLGLGGFYWKSQQVEYFTYKIVKQGEIKKIELADNTKVWLPSGSELRVPEDFTTKNRHVVIKGKVFFEVTKDAHHPFIVETLNAQIKVVGTSFSLCDNPKEKIIEAILVSGKIILQTKKGDSLIEMEPGEKLSYHYGTKQVDVEYVDAIEATGWHYRLQTFENKSLDEIVETLSAYYHVTIKNKIEKNGQKKYHFVMNMDHTLEETLKNLCYAADITYKIESNKIVVFNNKEKEDMLMIKR